MSICEQLWDWKFLSSIVLFAFGFVGFCVVLMLFHLSSPRSLSIVIASPLSSCKWSFLHLRSQHGFNNNNLNFFIIVKVFWFSFHVIFSMKLVMSFFM